MIQTSGKQVAPPTPNQITEHLKAQFSIQLRGQRTVGVP